MANKERRDNIIVENTRFWFGTNFAGDGEKNFNKNDHTRCANLVIPEDMAIALQEAGYRVKDHRRENDPSAPVTYTVKIKANYDYDWSKPLGINVISGDVMVDFTDPLLVGQIDNMRIANVAAAELRPWFCATDNFWHLDVVRLYLEQEVINDPFAERFASYRQGVTLAAEDTNDGSEIEFGTF